MPQFIDYTGEKLNNWNVISHDGFDSSGESRWTAQCDCEHNTIVERRLSSLKRFGKCPECVKKDKLEKTKREVIGSVYGKLTIVGYFGYRDDIKSKSPHWTAKCDCGSEKEILASLYEIQSGRIKSCGCLHKEAASKTGKKNGNHRKKYNTFIEKDGYYIGICNEGEFLFDKDDYDKIISINKYWKINNIGYVLCYLNNSEYQLHRYIMGLGHFNKQDNLIVDHINGDKLDNRKQNLRICKKSDNPKNCAIYSNNTSGYKGVTWMERLSKWQVNLQINKRNLYLGVYTNLEEAVEVRKKAEIKHFGEFSREYRDEVVS